MRYLGKGEISSPRANCAMMLKSCPSLKYIWNNSFTPSGNLRFIFRKIASFAGENDVSLYIRWHFPSCSVFSVWIVTPVLRRELDQIVHLLVKLLSTPSDPASPSAVT